MRTYHVTVNGQDYTIELDDPDAPTVTVHVNGKLFQVTLAEQRSSVQSIGVEAEAAMEEPYVPVVASTYVDTPTHLEPESAETPVASAPVAEGSTQVIAPMPGKVMDIVVKEGDQVRHGETLCSLEAMKMKSPIRCTVDGTIAQILISEGQSVKYGDILFTLS